MAPPCPPETPSTQTTGPKRVTEEALAERNDKHGPVTDDQLHREVEGTTPAAEGQPDRGRTPHGDEPGGTPPGMGPADVEVRAELARYAKPGGYPTNRAQLLTTLNEHYAPDYLVRIVQRMDPDRTIDNAQDLAHAAGLETEDHRF